MVHLFNALIALSLFSILALLSNLDEKKVNTGMNDVFKVYPADSVHTFIPYETTDLKCLIHHDKHDAH